MDENDISREIVDASLKIHRALGPGLFESVYEAVLAHELSRRGLAVARQVAVPVEFEGVRFEEGYRVDLLVGGSVMVELKSIDRLQPVHRKQVLTYIRLANKRLGLLVNFGADYIKNGVERIVNDMPERAVHY